MVKGLTNFMRKAREYSQRVPNTIPADRNTMNKLVASFSNLLGYLDVDIIFKSSTESTDGEFIDLTVLTKNQPIMGYIYYYAEKHEMKDLQKASRLFIGSRMRFIILTNGFNYDFFTDNNINGRLDNEPFLQIDLLNLSEPYLGELYFLTKNEISPNYVPKRKRYMVENVERYDVFHREPLLGEETAENDWLMSDFPQGVFYDTSSYDIFRQTDAMYLYGRRGSGKTAFIKKLEYEIVYEGNNNYYYVNTINQRYILNEIRIHSANFLLDLAGRLKLDYLNEIQLVDHLKAHWQWIIDISSMFAIFRKELVDTKDEDLLNVLNYLLKLTRLFIPKIEREGIRKLIENKTDKVVEGDVNNYYTLLRKLAGGMYLESQEYEIARESLKNFLNRTRRTCLVMIDSIDFYDLKDRTGNAITNAIIEAAKEIYTNWKSNYILVKVAFPSEISDHLMEINPDHGLGKKLFIEWKYRDLIIMIAKRYYRYMVHWTGLQLVKAELDKFNDYKTAREFLTDKLPEKIISKTTDIEMDTMLFIIMHTHKKPRQVIYILNIILTLANQQSTLTLSKTELIYKGTHMRLEELVRGTLNIYNNIYPFSETIIRSSLFRCPNCFDDDYLTWRVGREASNQTLYTAKEIKEMLIACGALGIEEEKKRLSAGKEIVKAEFQYQVPSLIFPSEGARYVIHPMFYPSLKIFIDKDKMIYPIPAEQSQEEADALKKVGIII